jgi:ankyrin repeat protein
MVFSTYKSWFSAASSHLQRDWVDNNRGYTVLGEAHQLLLEDDVEALEKTLAEDGHEKMGVMLVFACVHGARRCARYLVKQGAMQDIQIRAIAGWFPYTPITAAALLGHWEVVEILVEDGVDPYAFNWGRFSPLLIAAHKHPQSNLEYLLRLEEVRRHINLANSEGVAPLMAASASAVPLLVEAGADINLETSAGESAILQACSSGDVDKVKVLVEPGAHPSPDKSRLIRSAAMSASPDVMNYLRMKWPWSDVNANEVDGIRPINIACQSGHLEVVKRLRAAGAKIEPQASDETGAFTSAAMGGKLDVVKYLVEEAGADEGHVCCDGATPLMFAARCGHVEVVQYLVGRPGIDIEAKVDGRVTALDMASCCNHVEVVKVLVAAGARVEPEAAHETGACRSSALRRDVEIAVLREPQWYERRLGASGRIPLIRAQLEGSDDMLEYLFGRPGIDTGTHLFGGGRALDIACRTGRLEMVKLLVAAGARVNRQVDHGMGPLMEAALGGKLDVVKYLVEEAGADERRGGTYGWTPEGVLKCAAEEGHTNTVKYVVGTPGIDIEAEEASGATALEIACQRGHLEVVKVLVAAGARLQGRAGKELGVLASAISGGSLEVVKYLVEEAGADESATCPKGETLLILAYREGHTDIVRYLVGRPGIDINARTRDALGGVLHRACFDGQLEMVKFLVAAGASVESHMDDWTGVLGDAAMSCNLELVKYLVEEVGMDAEEEVSDGVTPLSLAEVDCTAEIVDYLRQSISRVRFSSLL